LTSYRRIERLDRLQCLESASLICPYQARVASDNRRRGSRQGGGSDSYRLTGCQTQTRKEELAVLGVRSTLRWSGMDSNVQFSAR